MTRRWLLLKLLEEAGDRGVTTGEILTAGVGSRYGARLLELREAGHVVEGERERDGSWRYRLVWSPDEVERGSGSGCLSPASTAEGASLQPSVPPLPAVSLSPDTLFDVQPEATPHWKAA
jgi:hypothetical protein